VRCAIRCTKTKALRSKLTIVTIPRALLYMYSRAQRSSL